MFEFKMPSLGAEMTSGTLLEWKVKEGERVQKGQIVAVVDTDKAAIDMEIWQEGVVEKLLVPVGAKVSVGTVLALLGEKEKSAEAPIGASTQRLVISPLARKRAEALGVDLSQIHGTGPGGAIQERDVEIAAPAKPAIASAAFSMRQAIAAAMTRSKREIPHYYLSLTLSLGPTLEWLERRNSERSISSRLLVAALYIKAVARACLAYPEFNGFWKNDQFVPSSNVNMGMAISLRKQGLIAPALLAVEKQNLDELMISLLDLVARARGGGLRSSEMTESSITITNLGDLGVDQVFGVIYPPQVALVGFGRVTKQRSVVLSLSGDHRASDGSRGALFLGEIGRLLERPEQL